MEKKIKPLSKQQVIISLDRLTRFKPSEEKYLRVFKDIVISNLIEPKYKKSQLDLMDYGELKNIAEQIFNDSLVNLGVKLSQDFSINKKFLEYEKSVFHFDKNVEKLLDNKIDYKSAISLLDEDKDLPLNLKWLKSLSEQESSISIRKKLGLKFPIEKVVIVEGITEEILLPKFAKNCGFDFDKNGIMLISAGGKKQAVKLFYQFAPILKLPIFVLLDADAVKNYDEIKPKLRKGDEVYIIKNGEFEDILSLNLIKRTLNKILKDSDSVLLKDLRQNLPMTQILFEIFRQRGLEFKKAEFASFVSENISAKDASLEIKEVISKIGGN